MKVKDTGFVKGYETIRVAKDGTKITVEMTASAMKDEGGEVIGLSTILRDITERKKAEEELRRHAEKLAALLNASQRLLATLDMENVLQTSINEAVNVTGLGTGAIYLLEGEMLRLCATTPPLPPQFPEELRVAPMADHPHIRQVITTRRPVIIDDTATAELTAAEQAVSKMRGLRTLLYMPLMGEEKVMGVFILGSVGEPCVISEAMINLSHTLANQAAMAVENTRLYQEVKETAIENANLYQELKAFSKTLEKKVKDRTVELEDAHDSLLSMVEDLTEARKNLEEANIKLQEADRLKSVFLASMSHELRTPLNSIIGFTGIMLLGMAGELNPEQKKQMSMVYSSAKHLLSLINDLLDISKIEAGKVEVSLEEFSISEVVEEVVGTFGSDIERKGLKLEKAVKDGKIYIDRRRFKQVLMNLLSNAIKFTPEGTLRLNAAVEKNVVSVSVEDTGVGIKKEDMYKLFQPFQQIELLPSMAREGTGLGLYLSKKIVTMLGGEIKAESTYKEGSRFTFSLPSRYKESEKKKKLSSKRQQK